MTDKTTIQRVREIVELFGNDQPPADDQPLFYDAKDTNDKAHRAAGGYGLDSLDRIEVAMAIEEEWHGFEVPDHIVADPRFNTIAGIAAWIDEDQRNV